MKMDKRKTADAGKVLNRITGEDPQLGEFIEEQKLNVRVAEMICDAREAAGLTQAALAKLVGTTQSVISRLEDADYEGRSLTMLERIASALGQRLEVRLVPETGGTSRTVSMSGSFELKCRAPPSHFGGDSRLARQSQRYVDVRRLPWR